MKPFEGGAYLPPVLSLKYDSFSFVKFPCFLSHWTPAPYLYKIRQQKHRSYHGTRNCFHFLEMFNLPPESIRLYRNLPHRHNCFALCILTELSCDLDTPCRPGPASSRFCHWTKFEGACTLGNSMYVLSPRRMLSAHSTLPDAPLKLEVTIAAELLIHFMLRVDLSSGTAYHWAFVGV